jgi:hypothetical protein
MTATMIAAFLFFGPAGIASVALASPSAPAPVSSSPSSSDLELREAASVPASPFPAAFVPVPLPTLYLRLEAGLSVGTTYSRANERKESATAYVRLNARVWRDLTLAASVEGETVRYRALELGPGYDWLRLDFGLAPRFTVYPFEKKRRCPGLEGYVATPFGLTSVYATVPPRRAFREEVQQTDGWFVGASAGIAYLPPSRVAGVFVEVAYARHTSHLTSTVTPFDTPQLSTTSHLEDIDHRLMLSVGGILGLVRRRRLEQ